MNYGETFVLKYISKENGKILFDVMDSKGNNQVLEGTMQDLNKILRYSIDLTVEDDFKSLQDSIFDKPITFLANRKPLKSMDELDFDL